MDHRGAKDEDVEVDLESGLGRLAVTEDDSQKVSTPCTAKQGAALFRKISCGLVKDSIEGDDSRKVYCNESNLSGVCMDVVKVTNKSLAGQDSVDFADKTPLKEKRKKSSNKMAPKPPRPPRAPSLDAADLKLMKEISELAMLKRARIERMKALKKMKSAKSSSSSSSSMVAMIFTVVFCVVIILQGNIVIKAIFIMHMAFCF